MTKDFARAGRSSYPKKSGRKSRRNTRRKPARKTKVPAWIWLLIGLLAAALIFLLFFIAQQRPSLVQKKNTLQNSESDTKIPKPRFDFYEILEQRTLEVPDHSDEITANKPDNIFYLQAGSFRNSDDADELRAELLLLNFEAFVEQGSHQNQTWHRVIVGPFESRSKVAKARSVLVSNDLSPLLLKRKNQ